MPSRIYECICAIGNRIIDNKDFLTELDREIGDADHGINMARGFTEVMKGLDPEETDIGAALKKVSMILISKVGGASGPLYGTAYMKAAKEAMGKTSLTTDDAIAMMKAAVEGIRQRGKSDVGEKTMLDALVPAYEALASGAAQGRDAAMILDDMCQAAADGAAYTRTIAATKGRASYLGDRSIGHQDPGATSSLLTLEAIRDYLSTN